MGIFIILINTYRIGEIKIMTKDEIIRKITEWKESTQNSISMCPSGERISLVVELLAVQKTLNVVLDYLEELEDCNNDKR